MAGLKALKEKRDSINKTRKVTRAMEAVSAVKMRKAQERALGGRGYAVGALKILAHLADSAEVAGHELFTPRTNGKVGIIVITSDKGLAGSLNSAAIKKADALMTPDNDYVFIAVGRRGNDFVRRQKGEVLHYIENKNDDVSEADMRDITQIVLDAHAGGVTREWHIVYTNFKSTFEQEAVVRTLLPLTQDALYQTVESIRPDDGKYSENTDTAPSGLAYTVEPSPEAVLEVIIPTLANIMVYHALLETKASEHSARMVAMKNATDKAGELSHELLLKFNKARQAVITREVSEITSGIEAMK